jgi:hypothetical protein
MADDANPNPFDEAAQNALVERVAAGDSGAPLVPETVGHLAALKRASRAKFETLRSRLKKAGCRVSELDELVAKELGEPPGGGAHSLGQADILVGLAEAYDLYRTPDEEAAADIEINGCRQSGLTNTRWFKRQLRKSFYEATGGAVSAESLQAALGIIEARAINDGEVRQVAVRVGVLEDIIYLDLCRPDWRAVEINKTGWRIIARPEIRFLRTPDMRALPEPVRGGSVKPLRKLLNIRDGDDGDDDFILGVAFLLACLRGRGPYPIMVVTGEQGTAKSTRSSLLRSVIDPSKPTLRALPRDERDLVIAARTRLMLAYDNISSLSWALSDAFCRISTGAGFGTRVLRTDSEEITFEGARPLLFNGIEDIVDRPDFAERSIFSVCEVIEKKDRRREAEVWADFDLEHPAILGALLDAVVVGLKRFSEVRPAELPRMADFAHWALACEPALWKPGTFMKAYDANIRDAIESVLEASPVAGAVRKLMAKREEARQLEPWSGTSTDLLALLTPLVGAKVAEAPTWPRNARALSGRLRRAASFLRQTGIHIDFTREAHTGERKTTITKVITAPEPKIRAGFASLPSPSSPDRSKPSDSAKAEGDGRLTQNRQGDANSSRPTPTVTLPSPSKSLKTANGDGGDGGDANRAPILGRDSDILSKVVDYIRTHSEVSSPLGVLFRVLGLPVDGDDDAMSDRLKAVEGDLAEHGIKLTLERGWVALERIR